MSVDISSLGLSIGDIYQLHNVEDYFNDIISGTYSGNPITIPMTGHTVQQPVGYLFDLNNDLTVPVPTPLSTFPEFGAFVLMKTSVSLGDVSADGIISAYDAALTARHAVDIIDTDFKNAQAADVDGNGSITAYDAALIAQKAVGLIEKFPVEG